MVVIDHELKRETYIERDWHKRERERESHVELAYSTPLPTSLHKERERHR